MNRGRNRCGHPFAALGWDLLSFVYLVHGTEEARQIVHEKYCL